MDREKLRLEFLKSSSSNYQHMENKFDEKKQKLSRPSSLSFSTLETNLKPDLDFNSICLNDNVENKFNYSMKQSLNAKASLIIDNLYIGGQHDTSLDSLNKLNIKYLLSFQTLPLILEWSNCNQKLPNEQDKFNNNNSQIEREIYLNGENNLRIKKTCQQAKEEICQSLLSNSQCSLDYVIKLLSSKPIDNHQQQQRGQSNYSNCKNNDNTKSIVDIRFKCLNVKDSGDQRLDVFFDECHSFIDEALKSKSNILIHCLAGISRSPSIAIAYLMRSQNISLANAYNFVQQCRPCIEPNFGFMGQLYAYEQQLSEMKINNNNNKQQQQQQTINNYYSNNDRDLNCQDSSSRFDNEMMGKTQKFTFDRKFSPSTSKAKAKTKEFVKNSCESPCQLSSPQISTPS